MPDLSAPPKPEPVRAGRRSARSTLLAAAALVLAIAFAYVGGLGAPFHFDDQESIVHNSSIRDLGSFAWMTPPATGGETVSGRPILNLSFALNYAAGGLDVRGYRAANVLIHACAALVLFGVVSRTWLLARRRRSSRSRGCELERADPARSRPEPRGAGGDGASHSGTGYIGTLSDARTAPLFAFGIALLWSLHPLQTGAVTYVAQRAESLAALFYLLTLYCFIRGVETDQVIRSAWPQKVAEGAEPIRAPKGCRSSGLARVKHGAPANAYSDKKALTRFCAFCVSLRPSGLGIRWWLVGSVVACLLGVGTKETVATAPLLVLLYDRAFVAGSFRAAWQARRRVYLGLAFSWLVLGLLVVANRGRGGSAGLDSLVTPWTYSLTQCDAIVLYLRLVCWPAGQVFDYGVPAATRVAAVWPQALLLIAFVAVTGRALYRNRSAGFLAAAFFLLLAPSSSFVPVSTQTIAEHRMYLPSAVVIALLAFGGAQVLQRMPARFAGAHGWRLHVLVVCVAVALGWVTVLRNEVYLSELTLWQDTARKRPDNPRAQHNLGLALAGAGRPEEATTAYRRALVLQPNHVFAHVELGVMLLEDRRWEDAATHFRAALAADPAYVPARVNLGRALTHLGREAEAIAEYQTVLTQEPEATDARTNLAALLSARGEPGMAATILREVLAVAPELAEAHYHFGLALEKSGGDRFDSEQAFREAVRLKPEFAAAHLALGHCVARRADAASTAEAERAYRRALELDSKMPDAWYGLGNVLARRQAIPAAIDAFQNALRLDPAFVAARNNLGNCFLVTGQWNEAIAQYEKVLERLPNDQGVRRNLELAREQLQTRRPFAR